jgi:precorrin-2 dehydrogenase/sirohydrochlorin ferrochelatase
MFFRLEGRRCLVVGGGKVAEQKIRGLMEAGARVRVIAPKATAAILRLARSKKLKWQARKFELKDISQILLVVAATSSSDVHEVIWRASRRAKVLCNVVDDPMRCDFFYPAVMRRGHLQVAVSTGGRGPALAQQIRKRLETQFGTEYAEWVAHLGRKRRRLLAIEPDAAQRKRFAHQMAKKILARPNGRVNRGI